MQEARELFQEGKPGDALKKLEYAGVYYREFLNKHTMIDETFHTVVDSRLLRDVIMNRDHYVQKLVNSYRRTQKSTSEKTLLIFSPILLAIGLAFRVAKVSARLFVEV